MYRLCRSGRSLIPDLQFERLAARIAAEHADIYREMAERIMDQALAFLAVAASQTGEPLSPTAAVDIGWHIARTLTAIQAAGYLTHPDLWTITAGCSQACSASGRGR